MFEMIKHPYNNKSIARLDLNNIVHNHLYHNCPIGKISANLVYDNYNNVVGKVDENGLIYSNLDSNPIGKVLDNGFVYKNNNLVGKIKCTKSSSPYLAGASYLLLIHENR